MGAPLNLLLIEDNEDDVRLILNALRREGIEPLYEQVCTANDLKRALDKRWDVILSDYSMPGFDAVAALEIYKQKKMDIPFLIVSGTVGEETAAHLMKSGAADFIMKGNLTRLVPAIHREIQNFIDKKEAEETIAEQQLQLIASSKMSALGELASGIAHEINSPLAVIVGKAGQLKRLVQLGQASPEKLLESASKIEQTAHRIARIVKGLRSFSRKGDNDPFEPVPLSSIIQDTVEICIEKFKTLNVELKIDSLSAELSVECRASEINQVLLNLLYNACDAVENLSEKWVRITARDLGECIEVAITDSGRGIPPECRSKILEPFFTTKKVGKGTGLGLSISKRIVESHGGRLTLDTTCGNTRFVVTLPKLHQAPLFKAA